jgi:hypothetical protein
MVLSEKGTVRGVLAPVLDNYAVGFFPVHGFSSATAAHDLAMDDDGRNLILLYVGDYDPSGIAVVKGTAPRPRPGSRPRREALLGQKTAR